MERGTLRDENFVENSLVLVSIFNEDRFKKNYLYIQILQYLSIYVAYLQILGIFVVFFF